MPTAQHPRSAFPLGLVAALVVVGVVSWTSGPLLASSSPGCFTPAAGSPVAVGTSPVSVAVGDFNADGRLDLAVANFSSNSVSILLGNGSGGFTQAAGSPVGVGNIPFSVA